MSQDKIFVIGATGKIGSLVVQGLIAAGVSTSILVRNEDKARSLFEKEFKTGHLHMFLGDYDNVESFSNAIPGHSRLFLLVADLRKIPVIKGAWGEIAYDSGVKQIVDLSSYYPREKVGFISYFHMVGEEDLLKVAGSNSLVILRPGYFMTNTLMLDLHSIKSHSKIIGPAPSHHMVGMVDPRDIADVAVNVFLDPIEKHGTVIYPILPDTMTHEEKARVYSKVLGREISYVQEGYVEFYNKLISYHFPHQFAYDFINMYRQEYLISTPQITIMTKKPIRTFEEWLRENKKLFLQNTT